MLTFGNALLPLHISKWGWPGLAGSLVSGPPRAPASRAERSDSWWGLTGLMKTRGALAGRRAFSVRGALWRPDGYLRRRRARASAAMPTPRSTSVVGSGTSVAWRPVR